MFETLRWLLIVPVAVAGWFTAFVGALELHGLVYYFCPAEYQVSGVCNHPAAMAAQQALVVLGAAVSAALVVLLPTLTAPAYKQQVAAGAWSLGFGVAIWAYLETYALGPFLAACIAGTATFLLVLKLYRDQDVISTDDYHQYELFI